MAVEFRVLEFYSGIGGMHYALQQSGLNATVVAALDINTIANQVYQHNFPTTKVLQRNIESISLKEFQALNADVFLMSPPCQPFTRSGKQGDREDPRTKSFFYILNLLGRLEKQPSHILVENVKGFETSETRNHLIQTLSTCNYTYKEFLLSPYHLGIPNQRLRYFLVAKQRPHQFVSEYLLENGHSLNEYYIECCASCTGDNSEQGEIQTAVTDCASCSVNNDEQEEKHKPETQKHKLETQKHKLETQKHKPETDGIQDVAKAHSPQVNTETLHCSLQKDAFSNYLPSRTIKMYLEELTDIESEEHKIDEKVLVRFGKVMDIVTEESSRTMCFTKAYFHYMEGTGSVLQMNPEHNKSKAFQSLESADNDSVKAEIWNELNIRFFASREIANLHHLPADFSFPKEITRKQQYRLLGNSLNCHVVAVLLRFMLS